MKNLIIFLSLGLLMSSCAMILNPSYQNIRIKTDARNHVLIDGVEVQPNSLGLYPLKRDNFEKQLTLKKEGFKDVNTVLFQYRVSPLLVLSFVPFGVTMFAPVYDLFVGKKAFDYSNEVSIDHRFVALPQKDSLFKDLRFLNVRLNLEPVNSTFYYYYHYRELLQKKPVLSPWVNFEKTDEEVYNYEVFSSALKNLLIESNYSDTNFKSLYPKYLDQLFIQPTILSFTSFNVCNRTYFIELTANWQLLDNYGNNLYQTNITSTSGRFLLNNYLKKQDGRIAVLKDALDFGLIQMLNEAESKGIFQKDQQPEMPSIDLTLDSNFVQNLDQAMSSTVTITNNSGHGSGFVISENGMILTNYSVIANASNSKIIFNDQSIVSEFEVLRVNREENLALIEIDTFGLTPFQLLTNDRPKTGASILAVGTPTSIDLGQSLTKGIISAERVSGVESNMLSIDAGINKGNDGGPVVNQNGQVLGIILPKSIPFNYESVSYALPSSEIINALNLKCLK